MLSSSRWHRSDQMFVHIRIGKLPVLNLVIVWFWKGKKYRFGKKKQSSTEMNTRSKRKRYLAHSSYLYNESSRPLTDDCGKRCLVSLCWFINRHSTKSISFNLSSCRRLSCWMTIVSASYDNSGVGRLSAVFLWDISFIVLDTWIDVQCQLNVFERAKVVFDMFFRW